MGWMPGGRHDDPNSATSFASPIASDDFNRSTMLRRRVYGGDLASFAELPREEGVTTLCFTTEGGELMCPHAVKCAWLLEMLEMPYIVLGL